jgi:hypothetical protein
MENIYNFINLAVLPFWLLMILAPRWALTRRLMGAFWPVAIVPLVYVALLLATAAGASAAPLDFSLNGIAVLLGTPEGALVAWAHFLAFDLFVGRWVYLDSRERGLNPWLTSIALLFVFLAGPFGLLLYLGLRAASRRAASTA